MTPRASDAVPFLPRLAGFVSFLRLRGLSIGIGAELDCANALGRIPLLDRNAFLEACKVTLAKSPAEVARLEEAFEIYWTLIIPAADTPSPLAVAVPPSPPRDGVTPAVEASSGMRIAAEPEGVIRVGMYSPDAPPLGHSLKLADQKRLLAIRAGARRFRRATATLPGRHVITARRGTIDFLATARHSLRQGGEWIEFRFQRRKRLRSELVMLWDVSGSMRDHDAGLFALVYALHRVVRTTRVFAFGTQLEEVTGRLSGRSYVAAAGAVAQSLGSIGGGTRIGLCLEDFLRRYGRLLHPWTSLVVLSDGWDLGDTARLGRALERMERICHLVVWVNPYADDAGFQPATAGMREALPHVDLLIGPRDFEGSVAIGRVRIAARDSAARSRPWGKAFIARRPSARAAA